LFDQLDPRDRDSEPREIEMPWMSLGRGPASDRGDDSRDGEEAQRERARERRSRDIDDPRDVFLRDVNLPLPKNFGNMLATETVESAN
jgi:hypothetical protein